MRQMISGLVAAVAVMAAAPAMACGYTGCAQPVYVAPVYVAPVVSYGYSGCNSCGGWHHERLADPVDQYGYYGNGSQQYYYVNQGPTYTGPGAWAPRPVYREGSVGGYGYGYGYRHHRWHSRVSYYPSPRHHGYPLRRYY
jgi:hypothetical protein